MEVHQRGKRLKMTFQWREVKDFQLIFFAYCVRVCVLFCYGDFSLCLSQSFVDSIPFALPSSHYSSIVLRTCLWAIICASLCRLPMDPRARRRAPHDDGSRLWSSGDDDSSSGCSITFEHVSMCFVAATETVLTISSRSCGLEERRRLQIRWSISQFHRTGLFYY